MRQRRQLSSIRQSAGFTLVELLVGLAILSAMTLIALPVSRAAHRARVLDSAAIDIASAARMTRSSAVRAGMARELSIDPSTRAYWSDGVFGRQLVPNALSIRVDAVAGEIVADGVQRIRFLPSGSASGGRIILKDGDRIATVQIDWLTGAAHVAR